MLIVIPARLASTRLPGKVLLKKTGKYLVQHVWEQARRARTAERVVIATDDSSVLEACRSFGAECLLTSQNHASGTSRAAEVARKIGSAKVVNVQGDEPEVDPAAIDRVARALDGAPLSTVAAPFEDPREAENPNRVKVVLDRDGSALYFSRSLIPYPRGGPSRPLVHLGVYGFRRDALLRMASLPRSPLEGMENLEQLRALENGMKFKVVLIRRPWPGGIDTPADYVSFCRRMKKR